VKQEKNYLFNVKQTTQTQ